MKRISYACPYQSYAGLGTDGNWKKPGPDNKKPLSSLSAEADSPRGAVL